MYETNLFYYIINCSFYNRNNIYNLGITLAQEKNETSEINNNPLITTSEIDESMETNNTLSQMANNTSLL